VFEIAKTVRGYAKTPTTLVSFDSANGALPKASLIADAKGDLFGTTSEQGIGFGTVFEITGSGFVVPPSSPARRESRTASARAFRRWPGNTAASTLRPQPLVTPACRHCKGR
jgi:hypothetical protein